jgi:hypothetical protein
MWILWPRMIKLTHSWKRTVKRDIQRNIFYVSYFWKMSPHLWNRNWQRKTFRQPPGCFDRGFDSRRGLGIFLFTTATRTALGPTHPSIQWIPEPLSLGVKRPAREADHSSPSSAEVKEWVELYLRSPNTPPWRGAQWKRSTEITVPLPFLSALECVCNLFFANTISGLTTCDQEHLMDQSCDGSLKNVFDADKLPQFWVFVKTE